MKRILAAALAFAACLSLYAQQYDVVDQVKADWRKATGMESIHRFDEIVPLTPAPEGYKPFYVSHYGRHGSRYAWDDGTYELIHKVLSEAHEAGVLTPIGEDFHTKYESFYEIPLINTGDLVPLGYEQHRKIAEFVFDNFPEVFEGCRKVDAVVSTSSRSIVSMSSFCLSLKGRNPQLDFYQSSTHMGMSVAAPRNAPKKFRRHFHGQNDEVQLESSSSFSARTIDRDGIIARLFTDPDFISKYPGGRDEFCDQLYCLLGGYRNYTEEPIFDNVVTPEQMLGMWESSNYSSFRRDITGRYANIPLLEDIIAKAETAMKDNNMAANLRFGHDYVAEAFMCLINANGCGTVPSEASEAKYWFQNYNIPMATTVLFVLYRNGEGDILFKLLWNEKEATLPQLNPVSGPYYRWNDFKAWAEKMMAEHPQIQ